LALGSGGVRLTRASSLVSAAVFFSAWWLMGVDVARSQETSPPAPAPTPTGNEQAQPQQPEIPPPRPGRFRVGPFYLTPSFKIGTIGLDSNTYYTPTGPRADIMGSGGPALEIVLPVRRALRLRGTGGLTYNYFVRTPALRHLTANGSGRLEWEGGRTGLVLEATEAQYSARPSLEIDRRLRYTEVGQGVTLRRTLFGRMRLELKGVHRRRDVAAGEAQLGVDLHSSMSTEEYRAGADLDYGLTVKTSLAATYERSLYRYPFASARDTDTDRWMGGLRTDATALIAGRAMAGVLRVWPRHGSAAKRQVAVYDVDATLNVSSKTHIGGYYRRDFGFSALAVSATAPTLLTETVGAHMEKDLIAGLNLELFARRTWLHDGGEIELLLPSGITYQGTRRDTADEVGADLGYRFRSRLRLGVAASYLKRRSTVSYFGIEGLLVGLSVRYTP
jgi:hypothetical protein